VVCCSVDPNPRVAGAGMARLRAAGIAVSVLAEDTFPAAGAAPAATDALAAREVLAREVLAREARDLNVGFFSRFERGRPWVRLKLAMSLDARTAPAAGGRMWISSEASRADVQAWRARSGAILTGAGTVRTDDPRLDVRLAYGSWIRQPLRVLLDPTLSCPSTAKLFHGEGALVFAAEDAPARLPTARVERLPRAAGGLDLPAVMARLADLEVNELLVECGPRLAGSLIAAMLVDELVLYMAPALLGADAAPLLHISGLGTAGSLPGFEFQDVRRIGPDLRLILTPKKI
jgi:diaminohydroxyphosphoribosylaminopyrimidine deaminase/5-amino-6-(5-phosphoribosylamino)uracil reductase